MRSTQYQPAPGHTAQILQESAIVARAIARHQREATLQGRTEEAHEMEALHSGVWRMAHRFIGPYQLVSDRPRAGVETQPLSGNGAWKEGKRMLERLLDVEASEHGTLTEEIELICTMTGFRRRFLIHHLGEGFFRSVELGPS